MSNSTRSASRTATRPPAADEPSRRSYPRHLWAVIGGLVVVILGAVGYFLFIPLTVTNTALMSHLLPTASALPRMSRTPAFSGAIPIDSSIAAVTAAAKDDPGHTGGYSLQWFGNGSNGANEDDVLFLLPTAGLARQLATEQRNQNLTASALASSKYQLLSRFREPAIDGEGVAYRIPRTQQNSAGQTVVTGYSKGYTVVLENGRAVIREEVQGPAVTKSEAVGLANDLSARLTAKLPTFPDMSSVRYPFLSSLIYVLVLLALLTAVVLSPWWIRRELAARRAHEAVRAQSQYRVRGSKHLKRHRALY